MGNESPLLSSLYQEYMEHGADPKWAISLQLASWIERYCWANKIVNACDLGSGFSSYVIRASCPSFTMTHSVDNDYGWLMKTRAFLVKRDVRLDGLMTLNEWYGDDTKYDFILFDLGGGNRARLLNDVLSRITDGGVCILDDCQRLDYYSFAVATCQLQGFHVRPLRGHTLDEYGRWAAMVSRQIKCPACFCNMRGSLVQYFYESDRAPKRSVIIDETIINRCGNPQCEEQEVIIPRLSELDTRLLSLDPGKYLGTFALGRWQLTPSTRAETRPLR